MNNYTDYRQYLDFLQNRLSTVFIHMYLYYYKSIGNDVLGNLAKNLDKSEYPFLREESKGSLIFCLLELRSFLDAGKSDKSLLNLYNNLVEKEKIQKKNKDPLEDILEDKVGLYKELKKFTNKKVAHVDIEESSSIPYDYIEKVAFQIEKFIYHRLPLELFNEAHVFLHEDTKKDIRNYLNRLYLCQDR